MEEKSVKDRTSTKNGYTVRLFIYFNPRIVIIIIVSGGQRSICEIVNESLKVAAVNALKRLRDESATRAAIPSKPISMFISIFSEIVFYIIYNLSPRF